MKHHQISKFFQPAKRKSEVFPDEFKKQKIQDKLTKSDPTKPRKLTPLEKQILEFKEQNPHTILAFQVGYKFLFYGEDAQVVSSISSIMNVPHQDPRFNYSSIPLNRLHVHLKKILSYGHRVGVIKQNETSVTKSMESSKGLFERELTGVYTAATYMNEESLDAADDIENSDNSNYICCIRQSKLNFGIVFIKPATGEIIIDDFDDTSLLQELESRLTYYKPAEITLLSETNELIPKIKKLLSLLSPNCKIEPKQPILEFTEELEAFFNQTPENNHLFEYYKVNFSSSVVECVNELIKSLAPFKLSSMFLIPSNITVFKDANYMILSFNVLQTLEIFQNSTDYTTKGSLVWYLNHTRTKMGERLLYKWVSRPLVSREKIEDRLNAVEDLTSKFNHFIDSLSNTMKKLDIDLEKNLMKLHYSADLVKITRTEVYKTLIRFNQILKLIAQFEESIKDIQQEFKSKELRDIFTDLLNLSKTFKLEDDYLRWISSTYGDSNDADEQRIKYFNLSYHDWEDITTQNNEIASIKQQIDEEAITVGKVLGKAIKLVKILGQENLIEVRNTMASNVPLDWIRIGATKTVTRYRSPELERLNKLLIYHHELLHKKCDDAFKQFLRRINDEYFKFNQIVKHLSKIDCYLSLAVTQLHGVKANILDEESTINIKEFKNPIIDSLTSYITNDVNFNKKENRISIITGPNMGGKSSYIKSVAILVIMNQIGCYLPCERASLSIFNQIFIRMGSFDNIIRGQSTFMVEMLEVKHILDNFTSNSLILLDEIGRGTGTTDGYLIANSILTYFCLHEVRPAIMFITHFHELLEVADKYEDVGNFYMDFIVDNKDEVFFLYKLVKGKLKNSFGFNVARMAGIPNEVIKQASKKAQELRNDTELKKVVHLLTQEIKLLKQSL